MPTGIYVRTKHWHLSEETKKRMSEIAKGRIPSEATRKLWSLQRKGRKMSEESRKRLSEAKKRSGSGKWMLGRHLSEETRNKISKAVSRTLMGHKVSEGTRNKLRDAKKGKSYLEMYGYERAQEIARKIRESHSTEEYKDKMRNALRSRVVSPNSLKCLVKGRGYWLGKKRPPPSQETRLRMSLVKRGKKPKNFGISWGMSGEKCNFWRGGVTPQNKLIRTSQEYKNWRRAVFERDGFTCQICGIRGGFLHADHIKPFAYFPELRFELSNGRTLCRDCHRKTDTFAGGAVRIYGKEVHIF